MRPLNDELRFVTNQEIFSNDFQAHLLRLDCRRWVKVVCRSHSGLKNAVRLVPARERRSRPRC